MMLYGFWIEIELVLFTCTTKLDCFSFKDYTLEVLSLDVYLFTRETDAFELGTIPVQGLKSILCDEVIPYVKLLKWIGLLHDQVFQCLVLDWEEHIFAEIEM